MTAPWFDAPLWASGFRPFFLLACVYAPSVTVLFALAQAGVVPPAYGTPAWHGHEMVFGFSGAVISGVLLTALPSWAGTVELAGARMALLAFLWLAGRIAMLCEAGVPRELVTIADLALIPVLAAMLAPDLVRAGEKRYLAVLGVLALLFCANLAYHLSAYDGSGASRALRLGVDALIVLYTLAAGVFTANFTANALRERDGGNIAGGPLLEGTVIGLTLLYLVADLLAPDPGLMAAIALAAGAAHALRLAGWKSLRILDHPLVWPLHLGALWLVASLVLRAAAEFGAIVPSYALHAFTAGALGITMLGLMTRVALRHTGRDLSVPRPIFWAWALVTVAALARLGAPLADAGAAIISLAALAWGGSFAVYLAVFWRVLVGPSLPRQPPVLRM